MPSSKYLYRLSLAVLLLTVLVSSGTAADTLRVPDVTTLQQGQRARIAVTGTIETSFPGRITLQYPADVIRILSVVGGEGSAWQCPVVQINSNTTDRTVGTLVVQCEDVRAVRADTIFVIEVEALFGAPRTGPLRPLLHVVGGDTLSNAVLAGGRVDLEGDGPLYQPREALVGNYPNPFSTTTSFVYIMLESGPVTFVIRNLNGRLIREYEPVNSSEGENTFAFDASKEQLSQGVYLVELRTERGSYVRPFMVLH
jgi:hypothetical protein